MMVTADGAGVVSHAGSGLLADVADAATLTSELAGQRRDVGEIREQPRPGVRDHSRPVGRGQKWITNGYSMT